MKHCGAALHVAAAAVQDDGCAAAKEGVVAVAGKQRGAQGGVGGVRDLKKL